MNIRASYRCECGATRPAGSISVDDGRYAVAQIWIGRGTDPCAACGEPISRLELAHDDDYDGPTLSMSGPTTRADGTIAERKIPPLDMDFLGFPQIDPSEI